MLKLLFDELVTEKYIYDKYSFVKKYLCIIGLLYLGPTSGVNFMKTCFHRRFEHSFDMFLTLH